MLLLDSRGNGRSSVVLPQTLARRGDARAQADYLMHFRADSIVRDAELIRRQLVGEDEPWSVLGQSYGGFCAVHYLSAHPHGLREVFVTGGLPPLSGSRRRLLPAHVSRGRSARRASSSRAIPADASLCARILEHLHAHEVTLPTGGRLTVRRFQQVGFMLGFDDGMENLHYLLESAFCDGANGDELSLPFLRALENSQSFETNPIFAVLHEMCYTQGAAVALVGGARARRVSRHGLGAGPAAVVHRRDDLSVDVRGLSRAAAAARGRRPARRGGTLAGARTIRRSSRATRCPAVAAIYAEDMYVPRALSEQTAASIAGMKAWLTNEYEHNGLRSSDAVFERLLALQRDEV